MGHISLLKLVPVWHHNPISSSDLIKVLEYNIEKHVEDGEDSEPVVLGSDNIFASLRNFLDFLTFASLLILPGYCLFVLSMVCLNVRNNTTWIRQLKEQAQIQKGVRTWQEVERERESRRGMTWTQCFEYVSGEKIQQKHLNE